MTPPMVALTAQLNGDFVVRGPALTSAIERMTCDVQLGPALHEGEVVLAGLEYDFAARGRAQGSHATLLLSDRRIYGSMAASNIKSAVVDLPLAQVLQVHEERGLLNHAACAFTTQGEVRFPIFGKQIAEQLRNVLTLSPESRSLGPLRLMPAAGDPVCANAAAAALVSGNPLTRALPALVYEAGRHGRLDESEGRALLLRTVILDRSLTMGRGMHQASWLTTLPRRALASLLFALLGPPLQANGDASWERYDFTVAPGGRSAGAAAAASAVGLASAALFGVGFLARSGAGLGFSVLRATLVDFPCGSGVSFAAARGSELVRLPFAATALLQPLFQAITRIELRRLLAEVVLRGQVPPEELANVPRATLEAAVAAAGRPLGLGALYG
jgi:hypothetical protein